MSFHSSSWGSQYPVNLPIFEGPLDLLLRLIEQQKLDISEVSLVSVTDSYLQAIDKIEEIESGALADFLVVAARLLYIKSRSLLPQPRNDDDEEEEDAGDALIRQLIEYRQFKSVATALRMREEAGLRAFLRMAPTPQMERKLDLSGVSVDQLSAAVQDALRRIPSDPPLPRVHTYAVTVAEQINVVRNRLKQVQGHDVERGLRFRALLSESRSRLEIVVTFLAVLELIKQQELVADQEEVFGEIVLRSLTEAGDEHH